MHARSVCMRMRVYLYVRVIEAIATVKTGTVSLFNYSNGEAHSIKYIYSMDAYTQHTNHIYKLSLCSNFYANQQTNTMYTLANTCAMRQFFIYFLFVVRSFSIYVEHESQMLNIDSFMFVSVACLF